VLGSHVGRTPSTFIKECHVVAGRAKARRRLSRYVAARIQELCQV
jgi:hypothetical protein